MEVNFEDGRHWRLSRHYRDFYEFDIDLSTQFPVEAGNAGIRIRTLPTMPLPSNKTDINITGGTLNEYVMKLFTQPTHISRSSIVGKFFAPREGDYEIEINSSNDTSKMPHEDTEIDRALAPSPRLTPLKTHSASKELVDRLAQKSTVNQSVSAVHNELSRSRVVKGKETQDLGSPSTQESRTVDKRLAANQNTIGEHGRATESIRPSEDRHPLEESAQIRTSDLLQYFSLSKDRESMELPQYFMVLLGKRIHTVLLRKETLPGYNDAVVRRIFAEVYTEFTEKGILERMDEKQCADDLILIFYSNATKALQKAGPPDNNSWKSKVDYHVALFVRLISDTLKRSGHDADRHELMTQLAILEARLLTNNQDASADSGEGKRGSGVLLAADGLSNFTLTLLVPQLKFLFLRSPTTPL